jgi:hypothetical protein
MEVNFVFACPWCNRRRQLPIQRLGQTVKCPDCGRLADAHDADLESAALLDPMKLHAELCAIQERPEWLRKISPR